MNLADLVMLANAYGSKPGDSNWNPNADLAPPYGIIGLTDLVTLAVHYGQQVTSVVIQASDPNDSYARYWAVTFDRPMPPMVSFQGYVGADVNEVHPNGDPMTVQWVLSAGSQYLQFVVSQSGGPRYGTYSGTIIINGQTYNFSGVDAADPAMINFTVVYPP